jgi:glycosyltransferase involved in cell wall biosynthesis
VVAEAFALETQVASRLGGLAELVGERAGLLVPPGDPGALAAAMVALHRDGARTRAMGEAARAEVAVRHTPEIHLEGLLAAYAAAGASGHEAAEPLARKPPASPSRRGAPPRRARAAVLLDR